MLKFSLGLHLHYMTTCKEEKRPIMQEVNALMTISLAINESVVTGSSNLFKETVLFSAPSSTSAFCKIKSARL